MAKSAFSDRRKNRRLWFGYLRRLALGQTPKDRFGDQYDMVRIYCYGLFDCGGRAWRIR